MEFFTFIQLLGLGVALNNLRQDVGIPEIGPAETHQEGRRTKLLHGSFELYNYGTSLGPFLVKGTSLRD